MDGWMDVWMDGWMDGWIDGWMDKGNKVQIVLLDMSAAFDTISHRILLDRLEEIGITDKALDLLKSYITNRICRTLINGIQSDEFQLKYGVPQGSVLGPLLFLIYLHPLSLLISKFPKLNSTYLPTIL